jgi:hypothetical protein
VGFGSADHSFAPWSRFGTARSNISMGVPISSGEMLDRDELTQSTMSAHSLLVELDILTKRLAEARTRNARWRAVIERHLERGCPSQSLRALLIEADAVSEEPT